MHAPEAAGSRDRFVPEQVILRESVGGKRNRMNHRDTPTKRRIVGQAARLALPGSTVSPTEGPPPLPRPSPSNPRPLSVCRDNLPFTSHPATASPAFYSERTNERTNASSSEKAHLSQPHLTPLRPRRLSPFSLLAVEFARRSAQSASSRPLLSRVSGKKPSSHGRPMQDEGRDQDIASGVSVRRSVHASILTTAYASRAFEETSHILRPTR